MDFICIQYSQAFAMGSSSLVTTKHLFCFVGFFSLTFRSISTECYLPHEVSVLFCWWWKNGPQKMPIACTIFWAKEKKMKEWKSLEMFSLFILPIFCVLFFFFCSFYFHSLHSRLILPFEINTEQTHGKERKMLIVLSKIGLCTSID